MLKVFQYLFSARSLPAIICSSLMLFFLGVYFLVALKSKSLIDNLKNETSILVEFNLGTQEGEIHELHQFLSNKDVVIKRSIEYVPKETAFALMEKEMGKSFLEGAGENPFLDVIQFNVLNDEGSVQALLEEITSYSTVNNAYFKNTFVENISGNIAKFSRVALVVGIFFTVLAITLIFNTIKLNLTESKNAFYTLKLLGSGWNFIKKPFLQRAFYTGVLSGILAILFVILFMGYLMISNDLIADIVRWWNIAMVSGLILLLGIIINLFSSNMILNRYLNMKEEELYRI